MKELLQENDWAMKMKLELLLSAALWRTSPGNAPVKITQMCLLKYNMQLLTCVAQFVREKGQFQAS